MYGWDKKIEPKTHRLIKEIAQSGHGQSQCYKAVNSLHVHYTYW